MIITVQGNNGKKNKCVLAAALIGGMAMIANGSKTLIVQLIDKDMESVEGMYSGLSSDSYSFGKDDGTTTFASEGIDALLRAADTTKLLADDFKQYCTAFSQTEFGLDVTMMTEKSNFREIVEDKVDVIKKICKNAKEYYENIILLLPTGDDLVCRKINGDPEATEDGFEGFADKSIYCLKQGHVKKGPYYGREKIFVVTDFDSASRFSLKSMRKEFCDKKDSIFKIERNTGCTDAYMSGKLLNFILTNRDLDANDVNAIWSDDVKALVRKIENLGSRDDVNDYEWEKLEIEREKHLRIAPEDIVDMKDPDSQKSVKKLDSSGSRRLPESEPDKKKEKKRSIFIRKRAEQPVAALGAEPEKEGRTSVLHTLSQAANDNPVPEDPVYDNAATDLDEKEGVIEIPEIQTDQETVKTEAENQEPEKEERGKKKTESSEVHASENNALNISEDSSLKEQTDVATDEKTDQNDMPEDDMMELNDEDLYAMLAESAAEAMAEEMAEETESDLDDEKNTSQGNTETVSETETPEFPISDEEASEINDQLYREMLEEEKEETSEELAPEPEKQLEEQPVQPESPEDLEKEKTLSDEKETDWGDDWDSEENKPVSPEEAFIQMKLMYEQMTILMQSITQMESGNRK